MYSPHFPVHFDLLRPISAVFYLRFGIWLAVDLLFYVVTLFALVLAIFLA